ncbi:arginase [Anaeromicrobium sediminis]|uniref:Arginase n=1 Tax=Anaeromicrobium sediminis TaxID=1478221 RepID=A0A267MDB8_9FIRM|nr:arginase [Anaeromicrobium sediminis]PAB56800.1 arginase [Anaeromicrobium sediminis]
MNINLIGAPTFYGADKKGPDLAPNKLRQLGLLSVLNKTHKVYDLGNVYVPTVSTEDKFSDHSNVKYYNPLMNLNSSIAHLVSLSLKNNYFSLVIGGDHSVALGSIAGISSVYKNFGVVWFDAHTDINTYKTSPSGNFHGMPLAYAMGLGDNGIENIYSHGSPIPSKNVFIIGARDIDSGEREFIKEKDLKVYSPEYIRKRTIKGIFDEIMENVKSSGIEALHISFDLDFLDASLVPGTGTPVGNGFSLEDAKEFFSLFASTNLVKSMDFVEYNVLLDKNNVTGNLSIDLLDHIFNKLT